MRSLKIAFSVLAFSVVLVFVLLFVSPATLLIPAGNRILSEQGLLLTEVRGLSIGLSTLTLDSAKVVQSSHEVLIEDLTAKFSIEGLISGELETLKILKLQVLALSSQESASQNSNFDSDTLSRQLNDLPIESIDITAFEYSTPDLAALGNFSFEAGVFEVNSTLQYLQTPELAMEAEFSFSELSQINGDLVLSAIADGNARLLDTNLTIAISNNEMEVKADSNINPALFLEKSSSINLVSSGISTNVSQVHLRTTAQIEDLNNSPRLSRASTEINFAEERLSFNVENSVITLLNPVSSRWSVSLASNPDGNYRFEFPDAELEVQPGIEQEMLVNIRLTDLETNCSEIFECIASMQIDTTLPETSLDSFELSAASITGGIEIFSSDSGIRLSPTDISFGVSNLTANGYALSGSFLLRNVVASFNNNFNLSAYIESNTLTAGGNNISLTNPSLFGDIELSSDTLFSSLILRLNNQVDIGLLLNHELESGNGSMGMEFREFQFSDSVSLSSLVNQTIIRGDLVRGSVAGNASLNWQANDLEELSFSGPSVLTLENLSGYVNDTYFVGLATEINAQFTSPLGLTSDGEQAAVISTLDTGLPVEQLSWKFEFDTVASHYNIAEFDSSVLGGNISFAAAAYSPDQASEIAIVLERLNLESIVALADYPSVEVDGFISGYLPIKFSDNRITIEEGLVGALNPGGTIRYTPANPVASSNPSVQLVNDALSNYQYKTMNTEVYYGENGDLLLEVQLQGTNPDMNGGQPINLNVNITDNIPTLLRSLRASRVITDALESSLDSR